MFGRFFFSSIRTPLRCVRLQSTKTFKDASPSKFSSLCSLASLAGSFALGGFVGIYFLRELDFSNGKFQTFPLGSTTPLEQLRSPQYGNHQDLENCVAEIGWTIGEHKVQATAAVLENHTNNGFNIGKPLPEQKLRCVVYVESTEDVSEVMKLVSKYSIPVVPFSGGTCLEGSTYSTRPCIIVNTSKMNKILRVYPDDLDAVLQAGVGWQQLNDYLSQQPGLENLMLGCDCGPGAHVCGMVNTNASGIGATRYGSMGANVISLKAVLADGTVVKTRRRPRKTSAGYNLTGLLVGSEGTLAIVTEVTVKLQVKQPFETVTVVQFPTLSDSVQTVSDLFKKGLQFNAVELLDTKMMECVNYSNQVSRAYDNLPTLFFKVAGLNETVVREYVKELKKTAKDHHCTKFEAAANDEEAQELFAARKNALYMMMEYGYNEVDENAKMWITDFAVPLSRLTNTLEKIDGLLSPHKLPFMVLGHVGDGNFHCDIFYKPDQYNLCKSIVEEMNDITLDNEGTCTGEHGVGLSKRDFLIKELGTDTINLMRRIKLALDPQRLLNPDKIFQVDPSDPIEDYLINNKNT
ncbi:(ZYRO0D13420g) [Zygosaccharomyces parabailii]|uniref:D-lactate dehydrogenase (cytochrome) n=1 Tax=Zygosaccharomyces bailii (strain CLIB 213 / ATCC 58445 / CBS 680 / BCRC 21525 / NBRC 1098 / NCYC 1416 / NRRL Y-2227) TaxID=1333698 RepID=A0A8J2T7P1_ZYGB2|nr:(ZYRO0D13420g) [Zygosaccharomyces parabailii]CDF89842.1 ZYBA0S05-03004g1_1 [Zygosaccharomyces bailii CLIB 213]CDH17601.1 related to D-lactate dehydrogenase [cytochrome],mitochondrial [Zygosaccharomyces bailii ISA1307]